jgi:C4-dicarboxylate transporter DctM subunit
MVSIWFISVSSWFLIFRSGCSLPPFGLNLFVAAGITKRPLTQVSRGVVPFLGIMLICLLLVTYIPWISLVLPKLLIN